LSFNPNSSRACFCFDHISSFSFAEL
jgi:hypothetical protein